jgi:hypothetical protein
MSATVLICVLAVELSLAFLLWVSHESKSGYVGSSPRVRRRK